METQKQLTNDLQAFSDWFNTGILETKVSILSKVNSVIGLEESGHQRPQISVSSLGKPMIELALRKLGYFPSKTTALPVKLSVIFDFGHWFERYLICLMEEYGIFVKGYQQEVEFFGLTGHIDFYLGDVVVDVKTMSDDNFKKFTQRPHDGLGYVTQLSVYASALGKKGAWLIFNKGTNQLAYVTLPDDIKEQTVVTAEEKLTNLNAINSLEDIAYEEVPSPQPEVYKRQQTGRFLIPPSMHHNPYMNCLYRLEEGISNYGEKRLYVTGIIEGTERITAIKDIAYEMGLG